RHNSRVGDRFWSVYGPHHHHPCGHDDVSRYYGAVCGVYVGNDHLEHSARAHRGLMVMLLTVVGFSGHRGQRRIDHLMLAYVVTQSHVAAGPETEPEEDFEESARHSE